ncbi:MAG: phosphate propanoyltransferase [Acholeplasmatales bacterium]|jgi:putative phosphotransacetylase|nr:phosphate propanoyltransferase [Acholeplasmatales bacterium]
MRKIPIGISGRHVHLSKEHLEILFGKDYALTVFKELSQPGQYACEEKVDLISPKGLELAGVRILGPVRKATQVEITQSDAIRYKFTAPIRDSGDISGSGACTIKGPKGQVQIGEGVILADRHIHFSLEDAAEFGVKDGDRVSLKIEGEKSGLLDGLLCRVSPNFRLDCHLDTDEGAAFLLKTGDSGTLVKKYLIVE